MIEVAFGRTLMVASVAVPLLAALITLVPGLRRVAPRIAPWTLVPAFLVAVAVPVEADAELRWLFVRTRLDADDAITRGFLFLTAVVWAASAAFARRYISNDSRAPRFWGFFLATMAGNVGLVVAQDVASFYAFFALMTFAAYGLVIHEQTPQARHAAQVYFVLAFIGELLLLTALLLVTGGEGTASFAEARSAVATSPHRDLIMFLLLAGFGVKAGAIPLHVWLPLAHPVAPTPASAVLSGVMIKAGLLGWLRFLPLGLLSLPSWGWACVVAGFIAAVVGGLVGATQDDAKTVLAYSSISQMGIMTIVLGVFIGSPGAVHASAGAIALFAIHHGMAKGSLFLGTAVAQHARSRWAARAVTAGLVMSALSIAGAPLTGGAVGKIGLHHAVERAGDSWHSLTLLLSVAAVASTVVMIRFLVCVRPRSHADAEVPHVRLWVPWIALAVLDLFVFVLSPVEAPTLHELVEPKKLWSGTWPMATGGAIALLAWYVHRRTSTTIRVPAGDLLVPVQWAGDRLWRNCEDLVGWLRSVWRCGERSWLERMKRSGQERVAGALDRSEAALARYAVIGSLLGILLLSLVMMLTTRAFV